MNEHNIGSVVVLRNGVPVGMLTERDILRGLVIYKGLPELKVGKLMSSPLITCSPETPILKAFALMHEHHIRRLPVMDGNKLVGIVTERDIIYWMLKLVGYSERRH